MTHLDRDELLTALKTITSKECLPYVESTIAAIEDAGAIVFDARIVDNAAQCSVSFYARTLQSGVVFSCVFDLE